MNKHVLNLESVQMKLIFGEKQEWLTRKNIHVAEVCIFKIFFLLLL